MQANPNGYHWTRRITALYHEAARRYAGGERDADALFSPEATAELAAIGATPIELYDYVEDADDLDWETALLIIALRRDYFLNVQNGEFSSKRLTRDDFPAKSAELGGIPWLPRLIMKALCRLRGELPRDTMYGCGGDRAFCREHDIHPADFLRFTWQVEGDEAAILEYVRRRSAVLSGPRY